MPEGAVASAHPDVGAAATLASTVGTSGYEDGLLGPGAGTAPQSWYAGVYVLTSAPRSVLLKPSVNEANVRLMFVPIALGRALLPRFRRRCTRFPHTSHNSRRRTWWSRRRLCWQMPLD